MKHPLVLIFLIFLLYSCVQPEKHIRWQIKKEDAAFGLTLGYQLTKQQLHEIIVKNHLPNTVESENGYLMLFIASSNKYYLDDKAYDSLRIAQILIVSGETTLISPFTIGVKNQALNSIYNQFGFNIEIAKIDLDVASKKDSMYLNSKIDFQNGSINLKASFLNNPGQLESLDSTIVTGKDPGKFFIGDEAYVPIQIDSISIISSGNNWITALNLPNKPDHIWLNTEFTWNFVFTKKTNSNIL